MPRSRPSARASSSNSWRRTPTPAFCSWSMAVRRLAPRGISTSTGSLPTATGVDTYQAP
jgi:hypothetical protein